MDFENKVILNGQYAISGKLIRSLNNSSMDSLLEFQDGRSIALTSIENYHKDFTPACYNSIKVINIKGGEKRLFLKVPATRKAAPLIYGIADDIRFNVSYNWRAEINLELIK